MGCVWRSGPLVHASHIRGISIHRGGKQIEYRMECGEMRQCLLSLGMLSSTIKVCPLDRGCRLPAPNNAAINNTERLISFWNNPPFYLSHGKSSCGNATVDLPRWNILRPRKIFLSVLATATQNLIGLRMAELTIGCVAVGV